MKKIHLALALAGALLTGAVLAQDICSSDGRNKMAGAGVTPAQVAKICPGAAGGAPAVAADYNDVKIMLLDGNKAIGKTIRLTGKFDEIESRDGKPLMLAKVHTDTGHWLWRVWFSPEYNQRMVAYKREMPIQFTCKIVNLDDYCTLIQIH